jgi:hypothetical protein
VYVPALLGFEGMLKGGVVKDRTEDWVRLVMGNDVLPLGNPELGPVVVGVEVIERGLLIELVDIGIELELRAVKVGIPEVEVPGLVTELSNEEVKMLEGKYKVFVTIEVVSP